MPPLLYGVGWNMCSKIVLQIRCAVHCTTYGLFFPTCHQIPLFLSVFRLINSFLKKSLLMVVLLLSLGFHVSFSSPKVMSPYWLGIPQTQTGASVPRIHLLLPAFGEIYCQQPVFAAVCWCPSGKYFLCCTNQKSSISRCVTFVSLFEK